MRDTDFARCTRLLCWAASSNPFQNQYFCEHLAYTTQRFLLVLPFMVARQPLLKTAQGGSTAQTGAERSGSQRELIQGYIVLLANPWSGLELRRLPCQTTGPIPIRPYPVVYMPAWLAIIAICWSALIRPPCDEDKFDRWSGSYR